MSNGDQPKQPNQELEKKIQEFIVKSASLQNLVTEARGEITSADEELLALDPTKKFSNKKLEAVKSKLVLLQVMLNSGIKELGRLVEGDESLAEQAQKIIDEAQRILERATEKRHAVNSHLPHLERPSAPSSEQPPAPVSESGAATIESVREELNAVINEQQRTLLDKLTQHNYIINDPNELANLAKTLQVVTHPDKVALLQTARKLKDQLGDQDKNLAQAEIDQVEQLLNLDGDLVRAIINLQDHVEAYKEKAIVLDAGTANEDEKNKAIEELSEAEQKIFDEDLKVLSEKGVVVDIAAFHPNFSDEKREHSKIYPWADYIRDLEAIDLGLPHNEVWSDVGNERCKPENFQKVIEAFESVEEELNNLKQSHPEVEAQIDNVLNQAGISGLLGVMTDAVARLKGEDESLSYMPLYDRKRFIAAADNLKAYVEKLKRELGVAPPAAPPRAVTPPPTPRPATPAPRTPTPRSAPPPAPAATPAPGTPPAAPDVDFSNFLTALNSAAENERDEELMRNWVTGLVGAFEKASHTHATDAEVAEQMEEHFNIEQADLESIEGWQYLTTGQQRLVLENLKQIMAGRIEDEAIVEERKKQKRAALLGRIWRGVFKGYYTAKERQGAAQTLTRGGLSVHGEMIEQLVKNVRASGMSVEIGAAGELELQYIAIPDDATPEQRRIMEKFNQAAADFSRVPHAWTEQFASGSERSKYEQAKQVYQDAKEELGRLLVRNLGDRKAATLQLLELDRKVIMNQFMQRHGDDLEEKLAQYGTKDIIKQAFKNVVVERGGYFAFGFISRSVLAGVIGLAAAPLTAAVTGGFIGRRRAVEQLREERQLGKGRDKVGTAGRGLVGDTTKLAEIKELTGTVDARDLIAKIERLIEQVNTESDEAKKKELRGRLDTRLNYTMQKLDRGEVGFGAGRQQLAAQYDLLQVMAAGETAVAAGNKSVMNELNGRLESFIAVRDEQVKKHLNRQMAKGAFYGATFAAAGVAARELWDLFSTGQYRALGDIEIEEAINKGAVRAVPKSLEPAPAAPAYSFTPEVNVIGHHEGLSFPIYRLIKAEPSIISDYVKAHPSAEGVEAIGKILNKAGGDATKLSDTQLKLISGHLSDAEWGAMGDDWHTKLGVKAENEYAVVYDSGKKEFTLVGVNKKSDGAYEVIKGDEAKVLAEATKPVDIATPKKSDVSAVAELDSSTSKDLDAAMDRMWAGEAARPEPSPELMAAKMGRGLMVADGGYFVVTWAGGGGGGETLLKMHESTGKTLAHEEIFVDSNTRMVYDTQGERIGVVANDGKINFEVKSGTSIIITETNLNEDYIRSLDSLLPAIDKQLTTISGGKVLFQRNAGGNVIDVNVTGDTFTHSDLVRDLYGRDEETLLKQLVNKGNTITGAGIKALHTEHDLADLLVAADALAKANRINTPEMWFVKEKVHNAMVDISEKLKVKPSELFAEKIRQVYGVGDEDVVGVGRQVTQAESVTIPITNRGMHLPGLRDVKIPSGLDNPTLATQIVQGMADHWQARLAGIENLLAANRNNAAAVRVLEAVKEREINQMHDFVRRVGTIESAADLENENLFPVGDIYPRDFDSNVGKYGSQLSPIIEQLPPPMRAVLNYEPGQGAPQYRQPEAAAKEVEAGEATRPAASASEIARPSVSQPDASSIPQARTQTETTDIPPRRTAPSADALRTATTADTSVPNGLAVLPDGRLAFAGESGKTYNLDSTQVVQGRGNTVYLNLRNNETLDGTLSEQARGDARLLTFEHTLPNGLVDVYEFDEASGRFGETPSQVLTRNIEPVSTATAAPAEERAKPAGPEPGGPRNLDGSPADVPQSAPRGTIETTRTAEVNAAAVARLGDLTEAGQRYTAQLPGGGKVVFEKTPNGVVAREIVAAGETRQFNADQSDLLKGRGELEQAVRAAGNKSPSFAVSRIKNALIDVEKLRLAQPQFAFESEEAAAMERTIGIKLALAAKNAGVRPEAIYPDETVRQYRIDEWLDRLGVVEESRAAPEPAVPETVAPKPEYDLSKLAEGQKAVVPVGDGGEVTFENKGGVMRALVRGVEVQTGFDPRASGWLTDAGPLREALKTAAGRPVSDLTMTQLYNSVRQLEILKTAAEKFPSTSREYAVLHRQIGRNLEFLAGRYKLSVAQMYPEAIRRTYLGG